MRIVFLGIFFSTAFAMAQRSVFVTPIANAPFMAVVTEQRTSRPLNGASVSLKSLHAIARSGTGVIYNENRALVPADFAGEIPVTQSHIYDPLTRTSTLIYPENKAYLRRHVARVPATEPPDLLATTEGSTLPESQFTENKDLGTKTMEGVSVHGILVSQKVAVQEVPDVVVTDEYWYSADLRLNMLIRHDDPRTGSDTITVTQVTRTEPDASIFQVPEGYKPLGMANQPQ